MLGASLLAAAMVATFGWAWRGRRVAVVMLLVEAVVWLRVDTRFEGPHLLRVTSDHGVVLADLVAVAAVTGAAVAWRHLSARPRRRTLPA